MSSINPFAKYVIREITQERANKMQEEKDETEVEQTFVKNWELEESIF
jgi:hypothetical protein